MVFNLDADEVGCVLLGHSDQTRTRAVSPSAPVASSTRPWAMSCSGVSSVATGAPLDGLPAAGNAPAHCPWSNRAPAIIHRSPVTEPLQTGIKAIDALLPIGRGQRELILGDRQTGKSAIALDAIINQQHHDVVCVYCCIGQRNAAVAKLVADLREYGALAYTCVVVAGGEDPPGLQFAAPYAATAIGEHFMRQGRDVLIVYDDLTHHARAYRELSLLLRRPPGREAYPGDIFYIHSRLSGALHASEAGVWRRFYDGPAHRRDARAGHVRLYPHQPDLHHGRADLLSPTLFHRGIVPAVDIGRSVSRVGGKAQAPAYQRRRRRSAPCLCPVRGAGDLLPLQHAPGRTDAGHAGPWTPRA